MKKFEIWNIEKTSPEASGTLRSPTFYRSKKQTLQEYLKKENARGDRRGLNEEVVEEIREAFNLFDTDGSRTIEPKKLKETFERLEFQTKSPTIYQMIAQMDTEENKNGIYFDDFMDAISKNLSDKYSMSGVKKIFDLFDQDQTNSINLNNLKKVVEKLEIDCTV